MMFPDVDAGTRRVVGMYGRSSVSESEEAETGLGPKARARSRAAINTAGHDKAGAGLCGARMRPAGNGDEDGDGDTCPLVKWDAGLQLELRGLWWRYGSMPAVYSVLCLLRNAVGTYK